jgi:hypothetical protein
VNYTMMHESTNIKHAGAGIVTHLISAFSWCLFTFNYHLHGFHKSVLYIYMYGFKGQIYASYISAVDFSSDTWSIPSLYQ